MLNLSKRRFGFPAVPCATLNKCIRTRETWQSNFVGQPSDELSPFGGEEPNQALSHPSTTVPSVPVTVSEVLQAAGNTTRWNQCPGTFFLPTYTRRMYPLRLHRKSHRAFFSQTTCPAFCCSTSFRPSSCNFGLQRMVFLQTRRKWGCGFNQSAEHMPILHTHTVPPPAPPSAHLSLISNPG